MDVPFEQKKLINVEYPGVVKNVNRMIATLGGEKEISKVYNDPQKRLELRLRSPDPYAKCAHGDCFSTTNLLMKVVIRKMKTPSGCSQQQEITVEILGTVSLSYKFKGMTDFQVVPTECSQGAHTSLLPEIVPTGLHASNWIEGRSPVFILPQVFSRFDIPHANFYRSDCQPRNPEKKAKDQLPANVIGRTRQRREGFAIFANFEDKEISSMPKKQAVEKMETHPCDPKLSAQVKEAFEERPIWSRNALSSNVGCDKVRLKYILPTVAYHFHSGPWRTLWVKFGYDPRKDPPSKIYQTLDFRFGSISPDEENLVKAQRKSNRVSIPAKSTQNQPRVAVIKTDVLSNKAVIDSSVKTERVENLSHEFHPGCLPLNRQSFYQLCDVHFDEVQNLVHANDGREVSLHEKDGWCEPGILDKCRELLSQDIKNTMSKIKAVKS